MVDKAALASCPKSIRSMFEEAGCGSADLRPIECQRVRNSSGCKAFNPPRHPVAPPNAERFLAQDHLGSWASESKAKSDKQSPGSTVNRDCGCREKIWQVGRLDTRVGGRSDNVGQRKGIEILATSSAVLASHRTACESLVSVTRHRSAGSRKADCTAEEYSKVGEAGDASSEFQRRAVPSAISGQKREPCRPRGRCKAASLRSASAGNDSSRRDIE